MDGDDEIVRNYDMGGGIVGYSCKSFTVTNSSNYGLLQSHQLGGIVGGQCSDFTVKNCKNNASAENYMYYGCGGIVGSLSHDFVVENCTNNHDMDNSGCGGIAGWGCFDFTIKKCKNNAYIWGWGSGGIVGNRCSNFKLYDCINTGDIGSSACGGICGANVGCTGYYSSIEENYIYAQAYSYGKNVIEINGCVNYGAVGGWYAGGICGEYLGRLTTNVNDTNFPFPYTKMPSNVKVTLNNCVNRGTLSTSSGGGVVGAYAGYIEMDSNEDAGQGDYGNIYGITHADISINKCETKSGSLCGFGTLENNVSPYTEGNSNGTFKSHNKLSVYASYVPTTSDYIVLGFGSNVETESAIYTPLNGAPTNLVEFTSFSAVPPSEQPV
jgi:hypothetical protein